VIPASFIQDLIARADVVQVVGRHVELKKAGINFKGLCPFHGEKTPSFIVSPTRQTYHCFGCGAHGDAVRFLMEHVGVGFVEAVEDLAQQLGMQVPDDPAGPQERQRAAQQREHQATLHEVLQKAGEHYRKQLKASPRAIDYLKGRGLTGEIAARFALGYSPEGWRTLASAFAKYDDPLLVDAGLVIVQGEDEAQQSRYDRFRDRIMFPIRGIRGEVIGFGGRVLDRGEPKYLNSPETPVFVKGRELYGLYEARQALRDKGYALVTEGYMDVVALAQLGFGNAVATLGTACTADHVQKLLRFTSEVVFSFDGDAAGRRAAARALEAALPHANDTRSFRFLFLPPEHDPDSYIREHGAAAFEQCVRAAVPLSRQLVEQAARDCDMDTAEGRARMLAQARPLLEALPAGLLREQLLAELAQRGQVAVQTLAAHWAQAAASRTAPVREGRESRDRREGGGWDGGPDAGPGTGPDGEAGPGRRSRFARHTSMAPRRPLPAIGKRLERAARIMLRHAELWLELGDQAHEVLAGQASPYGEFFAAVDRIIHDQGPLPMPAMLHELAAMAGGAVDDESAARSTVSGTFLQRLQEFHDIDEAQPRADMDAILHYLAEDAVDDELKMLLESGELSETANLRSKQLVRMREQLRASRPSVPVGS
jgi:DNA primase